MIIFLNGPFGIGKTTTAQLLVERVPGAMLYDPEDVGAFVRHIVGGVEQADDYQDIVLWRTLVVEVARQLHATYGRTLVVPMTIWRRDYFDALMRGLRAIDRELVCVRLTAPEEVLRRRILGRPDAEGPHAWCLRHMEVGLEASRDPAFGVEVRTEDRTPAQVADAVMELLPSLAGPRHVRPL